MKTKKTTATTTPDASPDYKNLIDLLAILTEATNQLAALKLNADEAFTEILDDLKSDYARLQETVTTTTASLKLIAERHPEWFENPRTLKTPYGSVSFHKSKVLDIPNEEHTLMLIQRAVAQGALSANTFTRTREELNLEALEKLSDEGLAILRIKRVEKENFTVKPATVDLGKAVKTDAPASQGAETTNQEAA